MLLDIQGCGYRFFDPEIASTTLMDGNEILFTTSNLSKEAIDTFIKGDVCNVYCNQLKLQRLYHVLNGTRLMGFTFVLHDHVTSYAH